MNVLASLLYVKKRGVQMFVQKQNCIIMDFSLFIKIRSAEIDWKCFFHFLLLSFCANWSPERRNEMSKFTQKVWLAFTGKLWLNREPPIVQTRVNRPINKLALKGSPPPAPHLVLLTNEGGTIVY